MYVDDLADALVHLLKTYSDEEHVNVGVGYDITICKLADGDANGRSEGPNPVRPVKARRHAAQAPGQRPVICHWLEAKSDARGRAAERLCVVPGDAPALRST